MGYPQAVTPQLQQALTDFTRCLTTHTPTLQVSLRKPFAVCCPYSYNRCMTVITGNTVDFFSYSPQQTRRIGQRLGQLLQPGDVVLISGPLGSGKTHLAQGIGLGLGIETPIRSPTFTLINEYHEGRLPLYHVDLYRLDGDAEVATIGLEDLFEAADGVIVVEWPEHAPGWMPPEALFVTMRHVDENKRGITISAQGEHYEALLRDFKCDAFGVP